MRRVAARNSDPAIQVFRRSRFVCATFSRQTPYSKAQPFILFARLAQRIGIGQVAAPSSAEIVPKFFRAFFRALRRPSIRFASDFFKPLLYVLSRNENGDIVPQLARTLVFQLPNTTIDPAPITVDHNNQGSMGRTQRGQCVAILLAHMLFARSSPIRIRNKVCPFSPLFQKVANECFVRLIFAQHCYLHGAISLS